jgi:hypothetical protein
MATPNQNPDHPFVREFLRHYLRGGMGAMSKSDLDALVMHLLDAHGDESGSPLGGFSNQVVSERLRTPVAKIKRLRYEAGLKFTGQPEEEGRKRFARVLSRAGLEFERDDQTCPRIVFVVEDLLAKNWIQGRMKEAGGVFDGSFNSEIIKVEPREFFRLLRALFPTSDVDSLAAKFEVLEENAQKEVLRTHFKALLSHFLAGVAETAGRLALSGLSLPPPVATG